MSPRSTFSQVSREPNAGSGVWFQIKLWRHTQSDDDEMTRTSAKSSLQQQIDENLKRVFEESLHQDVPDRFTDLLAQLRAKESANQDKEAQK